MYRPKFCIDKTGRSFNKRYTEQIKALTQLLIKSIIAEHIFNTNHTYTNFETNFEILHILRKGPKQNTTKQYTNIDNRNIQLFNMFHSSLFCLLFKNSNHIKIFILMCKLY